MFSAVSTVDDILTREESGDDHLRVLVSGVGNVLRQDDGFGIAVLQHLAARGNLPKGVRLLETGIAGIRMVQELMTGYDALIVVDIMQREGAPGQLFVLAADVPDPRTLEFDARNEFLADMHYTNPTRAMMLAKALEKLPAQTYVVACKPVRHDDFEMGMSDEVTAAVPKAADKILELIAWMSLRMSSQMTMKKPTPS